MEKHVDGIGRGYLVYFMLLEYGWLYGVWMDVYLLHYRIYQQLLDEPINFGGREMSCKIVKLSSADGEGNFTGCNYGQRGKVSSR
jgi:hypothetical protein